MNPILRLDSGLAYSINSLSGRWALLDWLMIACARYAPIVFALLLVGLWLSWRSRYQLGAAIAGIAALIALGIGQLVGMAVPRLRPYEANGMSRTHLLVPHSPDTSFPSDHATLALAVTVALWAVDRRLGLASLLFSIWLMFARVYIGAHYPSDVLGGAALGAVVSAAVLWVSARDPFRRLLHSAMRALHTLHLAASPK